MTGLPRHPGLVFPVMLGLASTGKDGDADAMASASFTSPAFLNVNINYVHALTWDHA